MRFQVIVLLLCGLLAAAPAVAEPRIALVIANGGYGPEMGQLPNPVSDGKLIAQILKRTGFKVTLVSDGDQRMMKRAITDFGQALADAGPGATGLFYYAGHGIQVGGANYLVPIDARMKGEADVDLEAVPAEAVLRQMEFSGAQVSIVVLDACRNNPLARSLRSATRGLAQMNAPTGSFVAYSTAPGSVAVDGQGRNSPFAASLAAEMVKPGLSIEEVFRNVRGSVMATTNKEQVPWDSSSLTAPFYFLAPPTGADQAAASTDTLFWQSIKDSRQDSDFRAYLQKHPNGEFAELARSRIAELENSPGPKPGADLPSVVESPLPDGTIVLSPAVATQLEDYLAAEGTKQGRPSYFFVAEDGQAAGYFSCPKNCKKVVGNRDVNENARKKAEENCNRAATATCVLLFSIDAQAHRYRISNP